VTVCDRTGAIIEGLNGGGPLLCFDSAWVGWGLGLSRSFVGDVATFELGSYPSKGGEGYRKAAKRECANQCLCISIGSRDFQHDFENVRPLLFPSPSLASCFFIFGRPYHFPWRQEMAAGELTPMRMFVLRLPCSWSGDDIIVLDVVRITEPYTTEQVSPNVTNEDVDDVTVLRRVKMILDRERARKS